LKASVNLFEKKEVQEKEVLTDTTVQEKNITFPADVKLQKKIIEQCRKIAKSEGIRLRQTYKVELKQLMTDQRFHDHRMLRNYLPDQIGDNINSILAAAGFNLRKMLHRLKSGTELIFELFENFILTLSRNLSFLLLHKIGVFHVWLHNMQAKYGIQKIKPSLVTIIGKSF